MELTSDNGKRSSSVWFLSFLLASFLGSVSPAQAAGTGYLSNLTVELLSRDTRQVSVGVGRNDGISRGMDFALLGDNGKALALIFPHEIQAHRFWSGSLSERNFLKINNKMPVKLVQLDPSIAASLRDEHTVRTSLLEMRVVETELEENLMQINSEREGIIQRYSGTVKKIERLRTELLEKGVVSTQSKEQSVHRMEEITRELESTKKKRAIQVLKMEKTVEDRAAMLAAAQPNERKIEKLESNVEKLSVEILASDTHVMELLDDLIVHAEVVIEEEQVRNEMAEIEVDLENAILKEKELTLKLREAEDRREMIRGRMKRLETEKQGLLARKRSLGIDL